MATIENFTAVFRWNCPTCGAVNYTEGDPTELNPEERKEVIDQYGTDGPFSPENLVSLPCEVRCSKCDDEHEFEQPDGSILREE